MSLKSALVSLLRLRKQSIKSHTARAREREDKRRKARDRCEKRAHLPTVAVLYVINPGGNAAAEVSSVLLSLSLPFFLAAQRGRKESAQKTHVFLSLFLSSFSPSNHSFPFPFRASRLHVIGSIRLFVAAGTPVVVARARKKNAKKERKNKKIMSVAGIDFGSKSNVVALARRKGIDVVMNEESKRETPSLINFGDKCVSLSFFFLY